MKNINPSIVAMYAIIIDPPDTDPSKWEITMVGTTHPFKEKVEILGIEYKLKNKKRRKKSMDKKQRSKR